MNLPSDLSASWLHRAGYINSSKREAVFTPRTTQEQFASVYTWWNILDAHMQEHDPDYSASGYLTEVQLRRMAQLLKSQFPRVNHYCEVGLGGGHSLSAMLLLKRRLVATVFQGNRSNYTVAVSKLLQTSFPGRIQMIPGAPEQRTLLQVGSSCNLMLVRPSDDADYGEAGLQTEASLNTMSKVAGPHSRVVVEFSSRDEAHRSMRMSTKWIKRSSNLTLLEAFTLKKNTKLNPCRRVIRRSKFLTWSCKETAFGIAKFSGVKKGAVVEPAGEKERIERHAEVS